jgi:hypothetical protein
LFLLLSSFLFAPLSLLPCSSIPTNTRIFTIKCLSWKQTRSRMFELK